MEYLKNGLLLDLQSVYRSGHSTETAVLLMILSDVLMVVDERNMAALALLYLSSAFDSIDHDTLLQRLQTSYSFDPHGSVVWSILFLLYTADLLQLLRHCQMMPHSYANDTQLCGFCRPSKVDKLINCVCASIDDASQWLRANRLNRQLNYA